MSPPLQVHCESQLLRPQAQRAAEILGGQLQVDRHAGVAGAYHLFLDEQGWRLQDPDGRKLRIDFDEEGPDYHRRSLKGKQEIVSKALGLNKGRRKILDLSAGLGQDAVFLSQLGAEVTAIERHPWLHFLLQEARHRTRRPELQSLRFLVGDSLEWLAQQGFGSSFEAAYFDPMYPEKKKTALPRQEMVLFRGLVGDDEDAVKVLELALSVGVPRVVVKRPLKAEPLKDKPTHSFFGSTVRYDVYVRS